MAAKIGMERVEGDIDLRVDNSAKNAGNLIEWNVDMKVTVSNAKKSKMFQRSRAIVLFLSAIVFAIILSHLRKEVRALQTQVQSVNANLLLLMSKYDRLNRSLNRAWMQRSEKLLENKNLYDVKRLLDGTASITKTVEILDGIRNATNGSSIVPYANTVRSWRKKYFLRDDAYSRNVGHDATSSKASIKLRDEDNVNNVNLRFARATLNLEKENSTGKDMITNAGQMQYDSNTNDDYYNDEEIHVRGEPRSRRYRRDEGRGPLVATFVGAIPEQHVTDAVYIGPWVKSTKNNTQYSLNKFHLVEDKKSIEVTVTGLYMISAQIFYFGEATNYSYWILLSSEGKSATQKLVKCSTASSVSATEVSCYTSVITPLQKGDRVHIQQQESNRLINMREGHSYIQLVLLSNPLCKRGSR